MLKRILNTWTIYILFLVTVPIFNLGASIKKNAEGKEPQTMYDAMAEKCPNLEATKLKENEILQKSCLNWAEINATTSFNITAKENTQCLVLYEAVISFCTNDTLAEMVNVIPALGDFKNFNDTVITVCAGNLYPNKPEHNMSNLFRNSNDCFLLCLNSNAQIFDICKLSYRLLTFNFSKLIEYHKSKADHQSLQNMALNNKTGTDQVQHELVDPGTHINPSGSKPKETEIAAPEEEPQVTPAPSKVAKQPALPQPVVTVVPAGKNSPENKDIDPLQSSIQKPQMKDNVELGNSPVVSEKDEKPEVKGPEVKGKDEEDIGDKSQAENGDLADQDMRDDGAQDQDYDKLDNGMPVDNYEPKETPKKLKPSTVEDEAVSFNGSEDDMDGDSYFFSYFTVIMCLFIVGYVGYHNRQKVLALILEGKKGRKTGRGRRPNSANYHKLDTNLEEAISSSCTKSATNIIY